MERRLALTCFNQVRSIPLYYLFFLMRFINHKFTGCYFYALRIATREKEGILLASLAQLANHICTMLLTQKCPKCGINFYLSKLSLSLRLSRTTLGQCYAHKAVHKDCHRSRSAMIREE